MEDLNPFKPEMSFEEMQSSALHMLEAMADAARAKVVTPWRTKILEYTLATAEAAAVIAMGETEASSKGPEEFPLLAASVPLEAPTIYAAALLVAHGSEQTAIRFGLIKRKVLEGRKAIRIASDAAAVRAAYEAAIWHMS